MHNWTCPNCQESVPADWRVCVKCGFDPAAPEAESSISRKSAIAGAFPPQSCLRCHSDMRSVGELRFHEGSQAAPFLLGNLGELLVTREPFDTFVCDGCGKVEFYAVRARRAEP